MCTLPCRRSYTVDERHIPFLMMRPDETYILSADKVRQEGVDNGFLLNLKCIVRFGIDCTAVLSKKEKPYRNNKISNSI